MTTKPLPANRNLNEAANGDRSFDSRRRLPPLAAPFFADRTATNDGIERENIRPTTRGSCSLSCWPTCQPLRARFEEVVDVGECVTNFGPGQIIALVLAQPLQFLGSNFCLRQFNSIQVYESRIEVQMTNSLFTDSSYVITNNSGKAKVARNTQYSVVDAQADEPSRKQKSSFDDPLTEKFESFHLQSQDWMQNQLWLFRCQLKLVDCRGGVSSSIQVETAQQTIENWP